MAAYIEIEKDGKGTETIKIPTKIEEMTLWQFCQYERYLPTLPEWYLKGEEIKTPDRAAKFMYYECKCLSILAGLDLNEVLELDVDCKFVENESDEAFENLIALSVHLRNVVNKYKPKERKNFKYKGVKYKLPVHVISAVTGAETVPKLKVGEYIEMNQFNHYWSMQDDQTGDFNKVLGILAVLARTKNDKFPTEEAEIEKYCAERLEHFKNLPMDIGRDVWFFFANIQRISLMTYSSKTLSTLQKFRQKMNMN